MKKPMDVAGFWSCVAIFFIAIVGHAQPAPAPAPVSSAASTSRAITKVVQQKGAIPVKVDVKTSKVRTDAAGKETLEPAAGLVDGDVIQFDARFTNMNDHMMRFDPQIGVPANTRYVLGSAKPANMQLLKVGGNEVVRWQVPKLPSLTYLDVSIRTRFLGLAAVPVPAAVPVMASPAMPASATLAVTASPVSDAASAAAPVGPASAPALVSPAP